MQNRLLTVLHGKVLGWAKRSRINIKRGIWPIQLFTLIVMQMIIEPFRGRGSCTNIGNRCDVASIMFIRDRIATQRFCRHSTGRRRNVRQTAVVRCCVTLQRVAANLRSTGNMSHAIQDKAMRIDIGVQLSQKSGRPLAAAVMICLGELDARLVVMIGSKLTIVLQREERVADIMELSITVPHEIGKPGHPDSSQYVAYNI